MSRASRSAGSCGTVAAIPNSANAASPRPRTGTGNWRWLSATRQTREHAMDVGMMMVFASYGWENCSDQRVWDEEIRLARLAADLGFDCLWSAEHHFNDYSF